MNALILIPLLSVMAQAKKQVLVTVDAKPNEVVTGERMFRVRVQSDDPVSQVEFYVGSDLRDSDTSTPYEFRIDTLSENEGPLKLSFKAYTSEGDTGTKSIVVTVDNQLSKGLDYHVDRAKDLLSNSKWQEALTEGRIALKIDGQSNKARLVLAQANLGLGVMDSAQKFAEDAVAQDPKDRQALNLLAVIDLKRAYNTVAKSGQDAGETRKAIADAIRAAVQAQRKSADLALEAAGQPTDANLIPYADAAIAARRYSLATLALKPAFEKADQRVDVAERLAYCQVREGLYKDAFNTLNRLYGAGKLDSFGDVLTSLATAQLGDIAKSDAAMQSAMLKDPTSSVVRAAQAYLALTFTRTTVAGSTSFGYNYDRATDTPERQAARSLLQSVATELAQSPNQTTETAYYMGALYNKLVDYNRGQTYFQQATLLDPINYDAYIEQGNRSIFMATADKIDAGTVPALYENARAMYEAALIARDDSSEALTGLALVAALQSNADDTLKWAKAAVAANPSYAAARATLSLAYNLAAKAVRRQADQLRDSGKLANATPEELAAKQSQARDLEKQATTLEGQARQELDAAYPNDPLIAGLELGDAKSVWRYYAVGGRRPLIPAPK